MIIKQYLRDKKKIVEDGMEQYMLSGSDLLKNHLEAMRYSLFAGGKRIRPILCIAVAEALGYSDDSVLPVAMSLECIHTYSLIHDDLPAMDNDDLRRGKPTNHIKFGEAGAILAGDGLLTFGFDLLSHPSLTKNLPAETQVKLIQVLARSAGSLGMVGGQAIDIESEGQDISIETLRTLHSCKTGALIKASVQMGAILGKANSKQYQAFSQYGTHIGLAFQIVDDLLNVTATTEQLGKKACSDAELDKATYPAFFGVDGTSKKATQAVSDALACLEQFDARCDPLRELAQYIHSQNK
ncbi:MAG: polyprenyl synthetase family protein [Emcibacter sp.]|nr:polyprenyl synthetase family protein [Emcibacter sp.]